MLWMTGERYDDHHTPFEWQRCHVSCAPVSHMPCFRLWIRGGIKERSKRISQNTSHALALAAVRDTGPLTLLPILWYGCHGRSIRCIGCEFPLYYGTFARQSAHWWMVKCCLEIYWCRNSVHQELTEKANIVHLFIPEVFLVQWQDSQLCIMIFWRCHVSAARSNL